MGKKIKIEDAKEGMVLASGVEDKAGRPILKAGDVIKETFIPRLKKWGIDEVIIQEGDEGAEAEPEVKVNLGALDKVLEARFAGHKPDSHMQTVKASVRKILVEERLDF